MAFRFLLKALVLIDPHLFRYCQAQDSCNPRIPEPLSIPIRNVSLPSNKARRGVALSIGSPPQPLAFDIEV